MEKTAGVLIVLFIIIALASNNSSKTNSATTAEENAKAAEVAAKNAALQTEAIREKCMRLPLATSDHMADCKEFFQANPKPIGIMQSEQILPIPPISQTDESVLCAATTQIDDGAISASRRSECAKSTSSTNDKSQAIAVKQNMYILIGGPYDNFEDASNRSTFIANETGIDWIKLEKRISDNVEKYWIVFDQMNFDGADYHQSLLKKSNINEFSITSK